MAIILEWQHAIMTSTAFEDGEKIGDFNIYASNALGAIVIRKDNDDDTFDWNLYAFFDNCKEFKEILGRVKPKMNIDLKNIKLNMYYKVSQMILRVLLKTGYEVITFYEEPENEIDFRCRDYKPSDFYPYGSEPMRFKYIKKEII